MVAVRRRNRRRHGRRKTNLRRREENRRDSGEGDGFVGQDLDSHRPAHDPLRPNPEAYDPQPNHSLVGVTIAL